MIFLESNITKDPIEMYEPTHESHIACILLTEIVKFTNVLPFPNHSKGVVSFLFEQFEIYLAPRV